MGNDTVKILGTYISKLNLDETVNVFKSTITKNKKIRICVTPVNCLLWANKSAHLQKVYNSAELCTADGVPLIWASRLLGSPIRGRVTGLDLLPRFAEVAAKENYTFFFLGAKDGVAKQLSEVLKKKFPGLTITGIYSPPFAERFSEEENYEMIKLINKAKPNVLWVSLTAPKQDYWIFEHLDKLDVNIAIGVGAAFDVVAGNIPRSPVWMQKMGLEWFYRLIREPGRLYRRYLIEAPLFIPMLIKQIISEQFIK